MTTNPQHRKRSGALTTTTTKRRRRRRRRRRSATTRKTLTTKTISVRRCQATSTPLIPSLKGRSASTSKNPARGIRLIISPLKATPPPPPPPPPQLMALMALMALLTLMMTQPFGSNPTIWIWNPATLITFLTSSKVPCNSFISNFQSNRLIDIIINII